MRNVANDFTPNRHNGLRSVFMCIDEIDSPVRISLLQNKINLSKAQEHIAFISFDIINLAEKELLQMNLSPTDITREIEKSAAVHMSEQTSSKRLKKIRCSKCNSEISTIAMEDDAVCHGVYTRCKCPTCRDWFEIRINADKIK